MEYYENIKFHRKEKGLTQAELAERVKVSRQTVVRWENGLNVPSLFYAQKLADCFEITVSQLMNGEEVEKSATESSKRVDLFASTVFICVLSFLPYVFYTVLELTIEAIRQLSMQVTQSPSALYRAVTDPLDVAQMIFCIACAVVLLAWWIAKFIGATKYEDKYSRYRLFNQWRVGLAFLVANFLVLLWEGFSLISMPWILNYVGGFFFSIPLVGFICILFKTIKKNWMIGENDSPYRKLNKVYFILSAVFTVVLIAVILILCLSTRSVGVLFTVAFILLGAMIVIGAIGVSYFVARACVYFSQKFDEDKEE